MPVFYVLYENISLIFSMRQTVKPPIKGTTPVVSRVLVRPGRIGATPGVEHARRIVAPRIESGAGCRRVQLVRK